MTIFLSRAILLTGSEAVIGSDLVCYGLCEF